MNAKILLIALSAAAITSCSTAYKSGQTPDDVYYSPVKVIEERKEDSRQKEATRPAENTADNNRIRMIIRDRRWRDFDNDYDYSYNNSPYRYCTCNCNNYGYYYNPYYYSKPLYSGRVTPAAPVNSTPRTVNLNTYKNYAAAVSTDPKTGVSTSRGGYARQYNTSNNGGSKVGNIIREVFTPNANNNSNNSNNNSNNNRTYTPSTNSNSGSSGSSSGGSSSGGTPVTRPGRG